MNSLVKLRVLLFSPLVFESYLNVVVIFKCKRLPTQYKANLTTIYELLLSERFHNTIFNFVCWYPSTELLLFVVALSKFMLSFFVPITAVFVLLIYFA